MSRPTTDQIVAALRRVEAAGKPEVVTFKGETDIHWCSDRFELYVMIGPTGSICYYADDYGNNKRRGCIETAQGLRALTEWLASLPHDESQPQ